MNDQEQPLELSSVTPLEISAPLATSVGSGPFIAAPGRTRQAMNWFFADKERLFWVLQTTGWLGFFCLHVLSVAPMAAGSTPSSLIFSAASSFIGFLTTSILLRPIYRYSRRQGPVLLLLVGITSTIAMTFAMSAVKAQTFMKIFGDEWLQSRVALMDSTNFLILLLPDLPANLFLLLSWAGFYFGINYYLTLRNETERALHSARLADQAQLKMLRYQLNPHFLFNTLNAISTLVLEKDGKAANGVLTRLSSFLRYSLDSDPLQKTTLSEELRALQLYLDIEATRFGDRLSVIKQIEPETEDALVPSLILQPAIENAIKYAIQLIEDGGEIVIIAEKQGDQLCLQVCDNGPNAPDDPSALVGTKTGVGLANMRERLHHLYGDNCQFAVMKREPEGLCVQLKFPFETKGP